MTHTELIKEVEEAIYPKDNLNPRRLKTLLQKMAIRVWDLEKDIALIRSKPPANPTGYRWHLKIEEKRGYSDYMLGREYCFKLLDTATNLIHNQTLQISPEAWDRFGPSYEDKMKQSVIQDLFRTVLSNPKMDSACMMMDEINRAAERATGVPKDFGKERFWRDGRGPVI